MQNRRGLAGLALSALLTVVGACTSFDSASNPSEAEGGTTTDPDGGTPPVTGTPSRGITLTVGTPNATAFVVQGGVLSLPVTLARKDSSQEAVAVTVKGLPPKVTAEPLLIPAHMLAGTLTLHAEAGSTQGPSAIEVVAVEVGPLGSGAAVKFTTFVRGKPGALDTTFGAQGLVRHIFGSAKAAVAKDLLIFDDGRIGAVAQCGSYACFSRTSSDGVLDTAYGTAGVGAVVLNATGTFGQAGFDGSGRVYLSGNGGAGSILIGRLTPTGQTDLTYNATGVNPGLVQYGLGPPELIRTSLAVRKDGTAFIGFVYNPAGPTSRVGIRVIGPTGVTIASFANGGFSAGNVMQVRTVPVVGLRANGNIWAAFLSADGTACSFQQLDGTNGTMDPAFGIPSGALVPQIGNSSALDLVVGGAAELPDGSLLASVHGGGRVAIGKIVANGSSRDSTWGKEGMTDLNEDAIAGVSIGSDGLAIVTLQRTDGLRFVRLTATGSVDTTFGDQGVVVHAFGVNQQIERALAQKDGRIVVIASEEFGGVSDVSLSRYWN